jgi:ADP-ribose pyrophosphatase YjhB (NUDIX family)
MRIGEMREKETQGSGARSSAHAAELSQPVSYGAAQASRGAGEGNHLGLHHRLLLRVAHLWFRLTRGMTLGVRAIVRDEAGRVFLVRHSYVPGWHLPGGGVEAGQTARAALEAELSEEGNFRLVTEPVLLGVYLNLSASKRDHVMLYLVENAHQTAPREPDHEIVECGFFALDALPEGTTLGTQRRLAELAGAATISAHW